MFVVLAVVFAGGFVVFGVGSGSTGVSQALSNFFSGNGGGGTSISSLQHKVQRNPADATAWRDLATAYETKQRTSDAVGALVEYTRLAPKDQDALLDLAGQYQKLAQTYATDYQNTQIQAASVAVPLSAFPPPANSPLGKALQDEPERPVHAGSPRPGRPDGERHADGDRRLQAVPEACAERYVRRADPGSAEVAREVGGRRDDHDDQVAALPLDSRGCLRNLRGVWA